MVRSLGVVALLSVLRSRAAIPDALPGFSRVTLRGPLDGVGAVEFVDQDGRVRVFHGTNVVVKGPPWVPERNHFDPKTSLAEEDFRLLRQAGVNLVRLGVMWAGAEPVRGSFNDTYLREVRALVESAASHGVYVLLDMHQDVFSESFCGEGLPRWAAEGTGSPLLDFPVPLELFPAQKGPDGFPTRSACAAILRKVPFAHTWASNQFAFATARAYENLYTNWNGLTDAWAAFWARVATEVRGLDNVLGFELVNEPFPGDIFAHPELLIPSVADSIRLQPAYDRIVKRVREVDQKALVFFAGIAWDDIGAVGFKHAPGGAQEANRSVLAFHYYEPPQIPGLTKEYVEAFRSEARRLRTGLLLTESAGDPLSHIRPLLLEASISYAHWEWKDFCREQGTSSSQWGSFGACKTGYGPGLWPGDSPEPDLGIMACLAVPYAMAVAGEPTSTSWNATSKRFEFRFKPDRNSTRPTEIFVNPALSFPDGMEVVAEPADAVVQHDRLDVFRLFLTLREAPVPLPQEVRLVLTSAPSRPARIGSAGGLTWASRDAFVV